MENKIINNLTSEKEIKNILGCLIFQDFIKEETKIEDIRKFIELQYEKIMKVFEDAPVLEEPQNRELCFDCKHNKDMVFMWCVKYEKNLERRIFQCEGFEKKGRRTCENCKRFIESKEKSSYYIGQCNGYGYNFRSWETVRVENECESWREK